MWVQLVAGGHAARAGHHRRAVVLGIASAGQKEQRREQEKEANADANFWCHSPLFLVMPTEIYKSTEDEAELRIGLRKGQTLERLMGIGGPFILICLTNPPAHLIVLALNS